MIKNKSKKRVVVIGGGNGSAVVLASLKKFSDRLDITGIVSMSDSGGSSGKLRRKFKTLPPGDIMRAVLSLSKYDYPILKNIFYRNRFNSAGKLKDHNLGNLFIVLAQHFAGNYLQAIAALETAVEAQGRVLPVTMGRTDLCVKLNNGKIIKTEAAIDKPAYPRAWKIEQAFLHPAGQVFIGSARAIINADYIIFAPGSLYTSVVAALLPRGIKQALSRSRAQLIYACGNGYRTDSETGPEKLSEFVATLEQYLPRPLDLVIYNNHKLNQHQKEKYRAHAWGVMNLDVKEIKNRTVVGADYERTEGGLCDIKLGKIMRRVLK